LQGQLTYQKFGEQNPWKEPGGRKARWGTRGKKNLAPANITHLGDAERLKLFKPEGRSFENPNITQE